MTSVVDATGYDNYSDIALAYFLGFFALFAGTKQATRQDFPQDDLIF